MNVKIGFWNINGSTEEKVIDTNFKNEINKHDIILLSETWQSQFSTEKIYVPNGYCHLLILRIWRIEWVAEYILVFYI